MEIEAFFKDKGVGSERRTQKPFLRMYEFALSAKHHPGSARWVFAGNETLASLSLLKGVDLSRGVELVAVDVGKDERLYRYKDIKMVHEDKKYQGDWGPCRFDEDGKIRDDWVALRVKTFSHSGKDDPKECLVMTSGQYNDVRQIQCKQTFGWIRERVCHELGLDPAIYTEMTSDGARLHDDETMSSASREGIGPMQRGEKYGCEVQLTPKEEWDPFLLTPFTVEMGFDLDFSAANPFKNPEKSLDVSPYFLRGESPGHAMSHGGASHVSFCVSHAGIRSTH